MLLYIWSKMWSTSQNVLLKLYETTSPQKLFPSDCITLYVVFIFLNLKSFALSFYHYISSLLLFFHILIFISLSLCVCLSLWFFYLSYAHSFSLCNFYFFRPLFCLYISLSLFLSLNHYQVCNVSYLQCLGKIKKYRKWYIFPCL